MPLYSYRALQSTGAVVNGEIAATNEAELAHLLLESRVELLEAHAKRAAQTLSTKGPLRLSTLAFCRQMQALLSAGVPFAEALETIEKTETNRAFRDALTEVSHKIRQGEDLETAFGSLPSLFDPTFLALLRAGEASGDLAACFARLAEDLAEKEAFRKRFTKAIRYPLFLLVVALGVTSFMLALVVPEIVSFLQSIGGTLPRSTRALIFTSSLARQGGLPVLLALTLLLVLTFPLRASCPSFCTFTDKVFLALPLLGPILEKRALSRFTRTLAILIESGVTLPDALSLATPSLANKILESKATETQRRLTEGASFAAAAEPLFPPFALQMLVIGENAARLPEALKNITRTSASEAQTALDAAIGALEPALTILVGALLAWVVLAVLGPVYGSLGTLGQGI